MKKRLMWLLLALLLVCVIAAIWWLGGRTQRQLRFSNTSVEIAENDIDIVLGGDSARITIYMFASYTCRHCHEFLVSDLPQIQQRYIDSGLVRFVIKPIELAENPDMMSALQLAGCMNRDGNADDIRELLLTEPTAVYSDEFRQLIDDIILTNPELAECLVADNFSSIKENNRLFNAIGSKGTPIFVVGGHLYKGRRNYANFYKVIDYELNK